MATSGKPGHYDNVDSLDEANAAAVDHDMGLRVQPRAPAATRYYVHEDGTWLRMKAGQSKYTEVDVESVRDTIRMNIPKNDVAGGGGVKAVDRESFEVE